MRITHAYLSCGKSKKPADICLRSTQRFVCNQLKPLININIRSPKHVGIGWGHKQWRVHMFHKNNARHVLYINDEIDFFLGRMTDSYYITNVILKPSEARSLKRHFAPTVTFRIQTIWLGLLLLKLSRWSDCVDKDDTCWRRSEDELTSQHKLKRGLNNPIGQLFCFPISKYHPSQRSRHSVEMPSNSLLQLKYISMLNIAATLKNLHGLS